MNLPKHKIPIVEIPIGKKVRLFIKREDLTHPEISGNKYWKMFYNVKKYLEKEVSERKIITFGGAFSNHIAAAGALGKEFGIETLGIIRGDELETTWQENPTLSLAHTNGMTFRFVTRETYRDKETLTEKPSSRISLKFGSSRKEGPMKMRWREFSLCSMKKLIF